MFAALAFALALQTSVPVGPVEFGRAELQSALRQSADSEIRNVRITSLKMPTIGSEEVESYRVEFGAGRIAVAGSDANGILYGLLEAAERVRNAGKDAWKQPAVTGKPYLAERGWNLFLPLPWDYEKNFIDNDPAALTDPARWFFMNDDYWRTLFDQMARSRLNWLDIHGPYDLDTTRFPNLYAYFIQSDRFPEVGVTPAIKAKLLAQLNRVIGMAHARGIKVSLMSYEARFDTPHNPRPPYKGDEAEVYEYTKEVVEKMIRQAPGLDKIGFRIGESGRGGEFFQCYLDAVKASGRDIPLYTRSWITRKSKVVPLAKASKDFTVEIKYNGEHWGAPYILAGGRSANWYSYFFEDYLSYSGLDGAVKMWPGVESDERSATSDGASIPASLIAHRPSPPSRWPSQPYKLVWQVRANGTHRIFPFYNPEWTRRSILSMKMGTTTGYTVESLASYFPQEPRFYWKGPKLPYNWIHQRDEMYMACWGRLGYDPTTPDWKFDTMIARKTGKARAKELASAWKFASETLAKNFMAYSLGPDHRSHAPELEWGGDRYQWLEGSGFDSHVFMSGREQLALEATGGVDGRLLRSEIDDFWNLTPEAYRVGKIFLKLEDFPFYVEPLTAISLVRHLQHYYVSKLDAGLNTGRLQAAPEVAAPRIALRDSLESALQAWKRLGGIEDPFSNSGGQTFQPFTDRLRMRTHAYHWNSEIAKIEAEARQVADAPRTAPSLPNDALEFADRFRPNPRTRPSLTLTATSINSTIPAQGLRNAWILEKPLPSSTFFHRNPMRRNGKSFEAVTKRHAWGHALSFEIQQNDGMVRRLPWWETDRPYLIVPSQQKPTPPLYSSEEAMTFLKPEVLDSGRYGSLLLGTRAWNFHRRFDKSTQRKLLLAVERGMNLIIMQQDFASGRYPLDWLPTKPTIVNRPASTSDPAGALGMEKIETADILWQPIEPGNGWEVHGNGGVASLGHGKGTIWIVQARLVQRMHIPAAARSLRELLKACSPNGKPVILVDAATENGDTTDSIIPDFMNAHDIPFFTLGEVIAQEQGMDSLTPIPGPIAADDILKGQGRDMANRWLKAQVVKAAKRPMPSNLAEFESERLRRKRVLLQSLGLDPSPPKTPLHARITGSIQRTGYVIDKLVYESRPHFFVTAHLYRPDPMPPGKMPVIVNVNGHWAHKKNEDRIQLRAAFQALQGYLALAIDSPGWSFEGNSPIERRPEGNHNDWKLFFGTNATGIYVWDVIRGLDYLDTRDDVDRTRIGITGASGGGLATLYAFAADDRFAAAASVVYMSSMELAPDNGCLCNHVPGTSQIGDRSDIAATQAPKPVLIMGAENDPEFPPDAMRLTGKKMAETWALFEKAANVQTIIFPGGHDYSQAMREASLGFFNKHLKGVGDGSPVPQPAITALPPNDPFLLALNPPAPNERTMRDLVAEMLVGSTQPASRDSLIEANGGMAFSEATYRETSAGPRRTFTLESSGLSAPGILIVSGSNQARNGVRIYLDDRGKHALLAQHDAEDARYESSSVTPTFRSDPRDMNRFTKHLAYFDPLGFGELAGLEGRYLAYLGTSAAFLAANQVVLLGKELRRHGSPVEVSPNGQFARLVAVYACVLDPELSLADVAAVPRLAWEDLLRSDFPDHGFQPRAHLIGSLDSLVQLAKRRSP